MRPIKERVTEYEVGYQSVYHYQLRNQSKCVTHMAAQGLMCDNDVMVGNTQSTSLSCIYCVLKYHRRVFYRQVDRTGTL